MKNLLRKIFFWDNPAEGAVFSWILSIVFGFISSSYTLFPILRGIKIFNNNFWNIVVISIPILQLLLHIYCLFLSSAFFFRQDKSRFKWIFWSIMIILIASVFISLECNAVLFRICICSFIVFAGFNALCIRKDNFRWYIALILCWIACLPGLAVTINIPSTLDIFPKLAELQIPFALRVPLVYSMVLFFAGLIFCSIKLWSTAVNKKLDDIWGKKCNVLLMLLAIFYIAFVCAALFQQKKCEQALADLEKNFQRKVSADTLKEIYYRNRKTDEDFHIAMENSWKNLSSKIDENIFNTVISEYSNSDKIPPVFRTVFTSPDAEKFGSFFDAPLPARKRDYSQGKMMSLMLPDLKIMRTAARFFAWQIRIACENKDYAGAMKAWKRASVISQYLKQDTSLISAVVMMAVEKIRLESLELMLSNKMLSDRELDDIQNYLQQAVELMPQINRDMLYFEAVFGNDCVYSIANNVGLTGRPSEGIRNYRFLAPGLWYIANCNYYELLLRYNAENLCKVNEKISSSPKELLAKILIPNLPAAGERMHELEMLYQAYYILIEAEKIQRKTGNYPEKLPLDITDYFSGKPLLYKIGNINKTETFLQNEKPSDGSVLLELSTRTKTVHGVAVWSVGKNKVNEHGHFGVSGENSRADDLRAMMTISR